MKITETDRDSLQYAKNILENQSLAAKLSDFVGRLLEKGFELLPDKWFELVQHSTEVALRKALDFAVMTMDDESRVQSSNFLHKLIVASAGAVGGAFGLPALAAELPVSTTIMLRSIADVARSEGEILKDLDTKLACLEVFALGGNSKGDNGTETGYFAVRGALAKEVSEAAKYIAEKGLVIEGAPALARFISVIAARFGVIVSQKAAAQAVPAIGAAGDALINTIFIDHFQDMARGHFIVRRLERKYGHEMVQREYGNL